MNMTNYKKMNSDYLISSLSLPVHVHDHEGSKGSFTPLNSHFRFSVYNSFRLYPNVTKFIFLEDDLLVSVDFLR